MVGLGVDKKMEPSGLCDGLNVGSEGRERNRCWCPGVETEHVGEWGRWREKGNARILFEASPLCSDWACFPWLTLPFTVELPFPLLCWVTFSLGLPGWVVSDVTGRSYGEM